ncbi:MAG: hypothetical protein AAFY03_11020, partial [Pseudomonadota bacterium]
MRGAIASEVLVVFDAQGAVPANAKQSPVEQLGHAVGAISRREGLAVALEPSRDAVGEAIESPVAFAESAEPLLDDRGGYL